LTDRLLRILSLVLLTALAGPVFGQVVDLANRPVARVQIEGLRQVSDTLVRNQLRMLPGEPYDPRVVEEDIVRITHLGRFEAVAARVEPLDDGSVALTYVLTEQPLIADVQFVGNKRLTDQALFEKVLLRAGDPIDSFLIDSGVRAIREAYHDKGFFVVDVQVDRELLAESNILIFRVREGPLVRIRGIAFEGNTVYGDGELRSRIKSDTYFPILRKGELSREQLELDAARVRDFYRERGYLDAEVGRRIDISPDQRGAVVVFVVSEGRQYTVDQIRVQGNALFPTDQILHAMEIRTGDVFSTDKLRRSRDALIDMYGKLGFIETTIEVNRLFHEDQPQVDLVVEINEGRSYLVGKVTIRGNEVTKDKVIQRQLRGMEPGRPFDRTGVSLTERRLRESPLFSEATVTIDRDLEGLARDVSIDVKEKNTGSLSFGAAIGSDAGVVGAIDLIQRNFDIADVPESWGEFFSGKAFRGAGQYFSITLQPGSEISQYRVNFREPYLFESDYFLDTALFYFTRERESYDEERYGASIGVGQRFGDIWSVALAGRYEAITIDDIEADAPVDVFDVAGDSTITGLGIKATRDTTDSLFFPTQGSRWNIGIERVGAFGGDYDFTKFAMDYNKFWTVDEDFFGRRTIVRLRHEIGYIFEDNEAPLFERNYAGGHRSFRGFDFRGVGPRGIVANTGQVGKDPVGGDWLFLLGLEYNVPVWGGPTPSQDLLRMVFFTDTGTVQKDFGFDEYRISVGMGLRLKIPFLGQAPFAIDFAVPLLKEDGDETQYVSFDLAVPFR
jgi:outer membrane protein insertion porin family